MYIVLISGYRSMGKDHLANLLVNNQDVFNYYSIWTKGKFIPAGDFNLVKFASHLKDEVCRTLQITLEELEQKKDTPLDIKYNWKLNPVKNPYYRHVLIDIAEYNRSTNPDYYVEKAAKQCVEGKINIITDWRYINECDILKYIDTDSEIITVRVHRDGVAIPPANYTSEHLITNYNFDMLFLPLNKCPENYDNIFKWSGYNRVKEE